MERHDLLSTIMTAAEMTNPARGHGRHHPLVLALGQQLPADARQQMRVGELLAGGELVPDSTSRCGTSRHGRRDGGSCTMTRPDGLASTFLAA
jgi:hypothetical protein